jgi:hypothetical protein
MEPMRFSAVMKIIGVNPYVMVSAARARAINLQWRKPLPVLVRINGKPKTPWRINMMPVGDGRFYLYLHGEVRKTSQTKVGDRVDVEVQFDAAYRGGPTHRMPAGLRSALSKNAVARKAWDALIPSRKKEVLRYFAGLKSPEARARNLARVMAVLSGSEERFMGRLWTGGV